MESGFPWSPARKSVPPKFAFCRASLLLLTNGSGARARAPAWPIMAIAGGARGWATVCAQCQEGVEAVDVDDAGLNLKASFVGPFFLRPKLEFDLGCIIVMWRIARRTKSGVCSNWYISMRLYSRTLDEFMFSWESPSELSSIVQNEVVFANFISNNFNCVLLFPFWLHFYTFKKNLLGCNKFVELKFKNIHVTIKKSTFGRLLHFSQLLCVWIPETE